MGVIDIIILIILVIAIVLGMLKGYKGKLAILFAFSMGILLAYFVGIPVARGLMKTAVGNEWLLGAYLNKLPTDAPFDVSLIDKDIIEINSLLSEGLTKLKVPTFIQGFVVSHYTVSDSTVAFALASAFSYLTLIGICVVFFFLLAYIVTRLIFRALFKKINPFGENGKNILGRIAGALSKVVLFSVAIFGLMFVVVLINQLMIKFDHYSFNTWLVNDLKIDEPNKFSLGKIFFQTANSLLGWINLR